MSGSSIKVGTYVFKCDLLIINRCINVINTKTTIKGKNFIVLATPQKNEAAQ